MKTSIIILTHNQLAYTKLCIESIRQYTEERYELIVVDNASTDGTVAWLQQQPDIQLIANAENTGFPKGCNQGIRAAAGEEILLLNNDVVVTPHWLYNLRRALWSRPDAGAVGPVTNAASYYTAISVPYRDMAEMQQFAAQYNYSDPAAWRERLKLIGFCMLMKRSVIEDVGELDERFSPGNFEDDDLSLRIRQKGYKLYLCEDVFVHHFGSVSWREAAALFQHTVRQNETQFRQKWGVAPPDFAIQFHVLEALKKRGRPLRRVLHIGCGCGGTLLEIRNNWRNAELYGVEEDAAVRALARLVGETAGSLEEAPWAKGSFDVVIVSDAARLGEVLVQVKEWLAADGCLLVEAGNANHYRVLGALLEGKNPFRDSVFYTLAELVALLEAASFTVVDKKAMTVPLTEEERRIVAAEKEEYECSRYAICAVPAAVKEEPLVSILIPTYNRPRFFEQALQSALAQTYRNVEILIGDDSTDDVTEQLVRERYAPRYPNITYIRNPQPLGQSANSLMLLERAKGEYINYLMDDDLFHPEKIARMMQYFLRDTNEAVALITSPRFVIDEHDTMRYDLQVNPLPLQRDTQIMGRDLAALVISRNYNCIGEPTTVLFRRSKLKEPFGTYRGRAYGCNVDVASWLGLLEEGDAIYIAEHLSYFRIHPGQQLWTPAKLRQGLEDLAHEVRSGRESGLLTEEEYRAAVLTYITYAESIADRLEDVAQTEGYRELRAVYEKAEKYKS